MCDHDTGSCVAAIPPPSTGKSTTYRYRIDITLPSRKCVRNILLPPRESCIYKMSDPLLTEDQKEALAKTESKIGMCKLAEQAPPNGAPDQLGRQARKHLAPVLASTEVGQLMADQSCCLSATGIFPLCTHYMYSVGVSFLYPSISKRAQAPSD